MVLLKKCQPLKRLIQSLGLLAIYVNLILCSALNHHERGSFLRSGLVGSGQFGILNGLWKHSFLLQITKINVQNDRQ